MSDQKIAVGAGGRVDPAMRNELGKVNHGFADVMRNALEVPFPANELTHIQRPDNVTLTYASVPMVIRRLNDVFGSSWSFEIGDVQYAPPASATHIVVRGCLTVHVNNETIRKEAFGSAKLKVEGTGRDAWVAGIDDTYKQAAGDALRGAAKLFGVGLDLWEGDGVPQQQQPRQTQQQAPDQRGTYGQNANPDEPAQQFQIDRLTEMFQNDFGVPFTKWTQDLHLSGPTMVTQSLVQMLLSHQHPYVASLKQVTGKNPPPRIGVRVSNA